MLNCLVRIKEGELINRLGIVTAFTTYDYCITFNFKTSMWFGKSMVEVLFKEPQFNHFGRLRCYWCNNTILKYFHEDEITNRFVYYCPKCLR